MCFLLISFVAYLGFLYLLRQRKVPVLVMRVWFTWLLLVSIIASFIAARVIRFLSDTCGLFTNDAAEAYTRVAKALAFRCILWPNVQHVHHRFVEGSLGIDAMNGAASVMNHTSFFDPLSFLCGAPLRYAYESKTFLKSSLRNIPLFGYVLRSAGHFPVYFADENSASFATNREKQAKVSEEAERFLSQPNRFIAFFPEGVLNRSMETLKEFRLGSFNTILKHRMPITYLVVIGHSELWHADLKGLPGFPVDIDVYVGRFAYDAETADAKSLADGLRAEMQDRLTKMLAEREKTGYKPWFVPPPPKEKKSA